MSLVAHWIRLRRPRNDSLGTLSGRGMPAGVGAVSVPAAARRAHHTKHCYVVLLFRHTVGEPPLTANVGGHLARGRCWQKPRAA